MHFLSYDFLRKVTRMMDWTLCRLIQQPPKYGNESVPFLSIDAPIKGNFPVVFFSDVSFGSDRTLLGENTQIFAECEPQNRFAPRASIEGRLKVRTATC